jgi:hypothetical protein
VPPYHLVKHAFGEVGVARGWRSRSMGREGEGKEKRLKRREKGFAFSFNLIL